MDKVFRALADVSRRQLLDRLNLQNGQNLTKLRAGLGMTRQAVSKHLAVLEAANLVTAVRVGREKRHYLNAAPINDIAERWITRYDQDRVRALPDLKRALEDPEDQQPAFVYTIYVRTTPEQLWQALTDPAFTRRYWGATFRSDWKVGSPLTWEYGGVTIADPAQVVLEAEPHRRLSYTWQSVTPEFAQAVGFNDELIAKVANERQSKVTFEIESLGQQVKLTVIHDGFDPDTMTLASISGGWPIILSSLKSLLETGRPLDTNADAAGPDRTISPS